MSTYKPKGSSIYYYEFMIAGRRYYGSTKCKSKRDAERVEQQERARIALDAGSKKPAITLDHAAALYEDRLKANGKWSRTQEYLIASVVEGLGADKYLSEVTQEDLSRHFAKRAALVSGASVNREIEVARPIWRGVMKTRDIGEMPDWGALFYAVAEKAPRELYHSEEGDLFEKLREDFRPFASFALKSGWRLSEVRHLRWKDLNLPQGLATTRIKGGAVIQRPLTPELVAIVANQPKVGPFVFTYVCQKSRKEFVDSKRRRHPARLKGERYPFTQWGWRRPWAKALEEAGIDGFRFHDLRHTRGTRLLRHTGNLAVAKRALAHKHIKTTLRYAHAADDDVRRGLEASESQTIPKVSGSEPAEWRKTEEN
jgi:integrase